MTIDIKNIDRSDWKPYKFDQIAESISERVEPQQTDLEIYVGLEHIDPETVHIKRWGSPKDVNGTKLKVYPGDVIFGKRRAYQRKAAIAEFEGICSAHAMVLRAKPDVIYPKLFPFFLHSDMFMHRAIDISVGSLSPTINWGTLKTQEFLLPPQEQQAKLAELLWAADEVVERYGEMERELRDIKEFVVDTFYRKHVKSEESLSRLNKYVGASINPKDYVAEKFLHYSLPSYDETGMPTRELGEAIQSNKLLITEDCVLFSKLNPRLPKIWKIKYDESTRQVASTEWLPVSLNNDSDNRYLEIILSANSFLTKCYCYVQGTSSSHKRIAPKSFYNLTIPFPDKHFREVLINTINEIDSDIEKLTLKTHTNLQRQLINQVFG